MPGCAYEVCVVTTGCIDIGVCNISATRRLAFEKEWTPENNWAACECCPGTGCRQWLQRSSGAAEGKCGFRLCVNVGLRSDYGRRRLRGIYCIDPINNGRATTRSIVGHSPRYRFRWHSREVTFFLFFSSILYQVDPEPLLLKAEGSSGCLM